MATKTIDRERIRTFLREDMEPDEIALLTPCSIRSVQRIAKEIGMPLLRAGRDVEDGVRLKLQRASYPVKVSRRPLERLLTDYK
jgi:hypothetical protein